MKKTVTCIALVTLFLVLAAQSSCREEACRRLAAVDEIRLRLADLGVAFDDLEDFLEAINDGRLESELAGLRKGHEQAVAAIEALLVIVKALCPEDRAEVDAVVRGRVLRLPGAPQGSGVDVLERRLEGILERSR